MSMIRKNMAYEVPIRRGVSFHSENCPAKKETPENIFLDFRQDFPLYLTIYFDSVSV